MMGDRSPKVAQVRTCRQSTSFLDSSIFETSHAEKLVQYIRQKRGINNAQRIFSNSPQNTEIDRSFPIEIEPTQKQTSEKSPTQKRFSHKQTNEKDPGQFSDAVKSLNHSKSRIPQAISRRYSSHKESIGRRVLLKEFDKTLGKSKFKPVANSTPNSAITNGDPNISVISRITPSHEEVEIPETQEPRVSVQNIDENALDECFQPLSRNNEVSDEEIEEENANPVPTANERVETRNGNSKENMVCNADEELNNESATLIGKENATHTKADNVLEIPADQNTAHISSDESNGAYTPDESLNSSSSKKNSPKERNSIHKSKEVNYTTGVINHRTHSIRVKSNSLINHSLQKNDANERSPYRNEIEYGGKQKQKSKLSIEHNSIIEDNSRRESSQTSSEAESMPETNVSKNIERTTNNTGISIKSGKNKKETTSKLKTVSQQTSLDTPSNQSVRRMENIRESLRTVSQQTSLDPLVNEDDCKNSEQNIHPKGTKSNAYVREKSLNSGLRSISQQTTPNITKKNQGDVRDVLSRVEKQLSQKPVVLIPINQNFHRSNKSVNEELNGETKCQAKLTSQWSKSKKTDAHVVSIDILTSNEENFQGYRVVEDGKSSEIYHSRRESKSSRQSCKDNCNHPLDLRTRRSSREGKRLVSRQKRMNEDDQHPEEVSKKSMNRKMSEHPSDEELTDKIISPLREDVIRDLTEDSSTLPEKEEIVRNSVPSYNASKFTQNEESRRNKCDVEMEELCYNPGTDELNDHFYNRNADSIPNEENADDPLMRSVRFSKSQELANKNSQKNEAKIKKRLTQQTMDPLKKSYLDMSKKLKRKSFKKLNSSRRVLYSKGNSDTEESLINLGKPSQETPIVPHSKEEVKKILDFSRNSDNGSIKDKNEIMVTHINSFASEESQRKDDVFKKPIKPPLKSLKVSKKNDEKKKQEASDNRESSDTSLTNASIPLSAANQSRYNLRREQSKGLEGSKYGECNSVENPVEPDEADNERGQTRNTSNEKISATKFDRELEEWKRSVRMSTVNDHNSDHSTEVIRSSKQKGNANKTTKKNKAQKKKKENLEPITISENTLDVRRSSRQRKPPVAYWSSHPYNNAPDIYYEQMKQLMRQKEIKRKPKNKVIAPTSESESEPTSKKKRDGRSVKKKVKGNKKNEEADSNTGKLKTAELPKSNLHQPEEDQQSANTADLVSNLFDQLKESFCIEKSRKQKSPVKISKPHKKRLKGNKEKAMISTETSAPSTAVPSSDDGISTSEENHNPTPPWYSSSESHTCKEDRLLAWLKNLSTPRSLTNNKEIVQILKSDSIKIANVEDLVFQEINGVEYAYYLGEQNHYGYMKFHPKSAKPRAKTKNFELKFLILVGCLQLEIDGNVYLLKSGDFVTVAKAVRYSISNPTADSGLLFFIRR